MSSDPRRDALRGLADTGLRLARGTRSAQLVLASLHEVVDPATLPPEVRDDVVLELQEAWDAATEPLAKRDVEKALKDAWGQPPGKVLDEISDEPVVVTPGAVVHRGVHEGADVAVKVLRPGLADSVRSDLGLLETLIRPVVGLFPALPAGALLREVRERVLDELDLEHEASTQRSFSRALRRHETLHVPGVVSGLAGERVLVSEWVDGTPVGELPDVAHRTTAAEALIRFHVGSARFGTVHCDPGPRNALLMDDGRVAFVDLGASKQVPAERVDQAVVALDAFLADDGDALGAVLEQLGWLPADKGAEASALGHRVLARHLHGASRLNATAVVGVMDHLRGELDTIWPLAQRTSVPPEDLWPLRMLGGLFGLLARLDVTADWSALVRRAAADGW